MDNTTDSRNKISHIIVPLQVNLKEIDLNSGIIPLRVHAEAAVEHSKVRNYTTDILLQQYKNDEIFIQLNIKKQEKVQKRKSRFLKKNGGKDKNRKISSDSQIKKIEKVLGQDVKKDKKLMDCICSDDEDDSSNEDINVNVKLYFALNETIKKYSHAPSVSTKQITSHDDHEKCYDYGIIDKLLNENAIKGLLLIFICKLMRDAGYNCITFTNIIDFLPNILPDALNLM